MSPANDAPTRTRLEPEVRRQKILETALEIIAETGYRGISMRGLARRCGMSAPGVMHYFEDLPTLLLAVLDYRDERDARDLHPPQGQLVSAKTVLSRVVARMASNPQEAQLFAVLEAESLDPTHPAHDYFKDRHARAVAGIQRVLEGACADPYGTSRRIIAILDGLQLHWLQDPQGFDLQEHWAQIADAILPSP